MIKEAAPDQNVIQLKSLEAFAKAADGKQPRSLFHLRSRESQVLQNPLRKLQQIINKSEKFIRTDGARGVPSVVA